MSGGLAITLLSIDIFLVPVFCIISLIMAVGASKNKK